MKKVNYIIVLAFILSINLIYAQDEKTDTSKFTFRFGLSEQLVGKDFGENFEVALGYAINNDMGIDLTLANATMRSKELDINYKLDKYAIQVTYDFGKSENSKLESIVGFSYINFDEKILEDDNNGLGIDIGVQTIFNLKSRFNYGLRIVSTYSSFSPGGILNAGAIFTYKI
ncbi:outer membrane beta-barrel protein [Winogradskyella helgolandensis]|uniref:outer membrane beta-barrel protein n=1 Tax=Winogradskyella helgolandensis TaxID=2697010 RepID=UPI0015C8A8B2|nr:outer membrane beta-barrel protein [Winogradskyella helgolandensis]